MNNVILKTAGFFKLYRPDVPVIVFLGTFAGRVFTTGFRVSVIYEALFLALFPYNFVYTLNSITDVTEDSVNKPLRPIPSGLITKNEALAWLLFLTVVSVSGISFIFKGVEMFLAFLIILLGFSYSMPPLVIKKRALLAPVITGWGVTHPLFITGGMTLFLFSLSIMLHAIGTTSLKDLTDIEGDTAAGRKTISATKGIPSVIAMSLLFKISSIILFQFTQYGIASIIPVISIFVVLYHYFYLRNDFVRVIYKRTIWTTAILSVFVIAYVQLF
ncbi:MAG TPA: UbiA family prenyltransferase [bacterium]|nr:UbiA family prenyltransferase [bacterium]